MTQLIAGAHSTSGHPNLIRASRPHANGRPRSAAPQTLLFDSDQIPGVGGKSMNGPINLLVKAALEVANDDQRNPVAPPPATDQPHPATVTTRSASHPHPYPHSQHEHPQYYAPPHSLDYGHYPDVQRQASGGSDRNRMMGPPPRDPRDDERYASHQGHGWIPPGPPPAGYDYHHQPPPPHHAQGYYGGPRYHHPPSHPYPPQGFHESGWQGPPPQHGARHDWPPEAYYRPTSHSSEDQMKHGQNDGGAQRGESASLQKRYREVSRHSSSPEEPSGASGSSKTLSSGSSDDYQPTTKRTRTNPARSTRASARLRPTTVKEESPETTSPDSMNSLRESNGSSKTEIDNGGEEEGDGEGNDDQEDANGDEEKPEPKRRKYVRRDQARRKEQNAQAQKKFRQKKKKLAEQMKTDLDEALERARALAEKLDNANEQIAAMGVEINQLRLGMMKCKCIGPDT